MAMKRWLSVSYELMQILPGDGWFAVFALRKDGDEFCHLACSPVDFIGLAKETDHYMERPEDAPAGTFGVEYDHDYGTAIVAIEMLDGFDHICNDADNFAGICRRGQNIYLAVGCLDTAKYPLPDPRPVVLAGVDAPQEG